MHEATPRATAILPAGSWPEAEARDEVRLDFDERFRRRKLYTGAGGLVFLLDLPEATVLREGDGLVLTGGGFVRVRAAAEPLIEITAAAPAELLRIAWHLGNRHLPAEIAEARILIRHDHVILRMLEGLGARTRRIEAPFHPEGGAYGEHNRAPGHPHAEPHGHPHGHGHAHHHG